MQGLKYLLLPVLAYLAGSIPFGRVVTRVFTGVDLRAEGSGNIGATNVARTAGVRWGLVTLAGDVLKGAVPVALGVSLAGRDGPWAECYLALVAAAAFSGHLLPVYTRFRGGGKGVATAAGCFLVLSPAAAGVSFLVFVLLVCASGRVSVGSLGAAVLLPLAVHKAGGSAVFTALAAGFALAVFIRHGANLARLLAGREPPLASGNPGPVLTRPRARRKEPTRPG